LGKSGEYLPWWCRSRRRSFRRWVAAVAREHGRASVGWRDHDDRRCVATLTRLLGGIGLAEEADAAHAEAITLATNDTERTFLEIRRARLTTAPTSAKRLTGRNAGKKNGISNVGCRRVRHISCIRLLSPILTRYRAMTFVRRQLFVTELQTALTSRVLLCGGWADRVL
jgi:hypothetical protein